MASGAVFYNPYHEYNVLEAATYAGFHRLTWAVGTLGLLLTASYGHSTLIQRVLSWSPFVPLSKLVYGAYLMHMSFQFRSLGMTPGSQLFDYFNLVSWQDTFMNYYEEYTIFVEIASKIQHIHENIFIRNSENC